MGSSTPAPLNLYKPDDSELVDVDVHLGDNYDKINDWAAPRNAEYPVPKPFFHVYQESPAQTAVANATDTAVNMTGEHEDSTGSGHSNSVNPSRVTPGIAGIYKVKGQAAFAGNTAGDRSAHIRVNGAKVPYKSAYSGVPAPNGTGFIAATVLVESPSLRLDADDYVELWCGQNSGGPLDLFADPDFTTSWLSVEFVRPV